MKTTNVLFQALILVLAAAFVNGCATMKVTSLPQRSPESCEYHDQQKGLAIGVHPVTDRREVKEIFKTDLRSKGVLPILVVAENRNSTMSSSTSDSATGDVVPFDFKVTLTP
jgi:hypothetical protein